MSSYCDGLTPSCPSQLTATHVGGSTSVTSGLQPFKNLLAKLALALSISRRRAKDNSIITWYFCKPRCLLSISLLHLINWDITFPALTIVYNHRWFNADKVISVQ